MNTDFTKSPDGLIPAIIQDYRNLQVLMLGYMNSEALQKTKAEGVVCFYSRSKKRLWTKGETSGNFFYVKDILQDCDRDAILIKVNPAGPACHTGSTSCFNDEQHKGFIYKLEEIIKERVTGNSENSYTKKIYEKGINKMAQKVGEEAVELIIEAKDNEPELFKNEAADLIYHLLILLKAKDFTFEDIEEVLSLRHKIR